MGVARNRGQGEHFCSPSTFCDAVAQWIASKQARICSPQIEGGERTGRYVWTGGAGLTSMVWDAGGTHGWERESHTRVHVPGRGVAECMMEHHAHGNKDARRPETRHTGMHAPGYPSHEHLLT